MTNEQLRKSMPRRLGSIKGHIAGIENMVKEKNVRISFFSWVL